MLFLRLFIALTIWISPFATAETPCWASMGGKDIVTLSPGPKQKQVRPTSIKNLRISTFNIENFFLLKGSQEAKSPEDIRAIADMITKHIKPDILAVQEIESEESLELFTSKNLKSQYEGTARGTNDFRLIRVGTLDHRRLPFEIELRQNTATMWNDPKTDLRPQKLFSRDALVSIYSIQEAIKPFLITINVHFKSQADRLKDPESKRLRSAQIAEVAYNIIPKLEREFGKGIGVIVFGDINTDVLSAPELEPLRKLGYRDVLDLMKVPLEDRITHTHHPEEGPAEKSQMDGIFLSPSLQRYLRGARTHRYGAHTADTLAARTAQPSDHIPVSADIDFTEPIAESLR